MECGLPCKYLYRQVNLFVKLSNNEYLSLKKQFISVSQLNVLLKLTSLSLCNVVQCVYGESPLPLKLNFSFDGILKSKLVDDECLENELLKESKDTRICLEVIHYRKAHALKKVFTFIALNDVASLP